MKKNRIRLLSVVLACGIMLTFGQSAIFVISEGKEIRLE